MSQQNRYEAFPKIWEARFKGVVEQQLGHPSISVMVCNYLPVLQVSFDSKICVPGVKWLHLASDDVWKAILGVTHNCAELGSVESRFILFYLAGRN